MIKLNEDIEFVLKKLLEYGEGYIVGGYIRDYFLGIEPNDCDFTTNIEQERLKEIFKQYSPKSIHKKLEVTRIKYNKVYYQIARIRGEEGETLEERLFQDLIKRDITVNTLAFDGENLHYIDGAMEDLENRIIRFIGIPNKTIEEDSIRILRAIRIFGSKKFDSFDEESRKAIARNRFLLLKVDRSRIILEFEKIFGSDNLGVIFKTLDELKVLEVIFPYVKGIDMSLAYSLLDNPPNSYSTKIAYFLYPIYNKIIKENHLGYAEEKSIEILKSLGINEKVSKKVRNLLRNQYYFFKLEWKDEKIIRHELLNFFKNSGYPKGFYEKVLDFIDKETDFKYVISEKKLRLISNNMKKSEFPKFFNFILHLHKFDKKGVTLDYVEKGINRIKEILEEENKIILEENDVR